MDLGAECKSSPPASFKCLSDNKAGRFICDTCCKRFKKPCLLHRHEVVHSSEKPYSCSKCSKRFTQSSSLQRHRAEQHKPDRKRYQCGKCPLSFGQKGNLNIHGKKVHPTKAIGTHVCDLCESVYSNKQKLSRHINTVHSNSSKHKSAIGKSNDIVQDDLALTQRVLEQLKTFQREMQALESQSMETTDNLERPIITVLNSAHQTNKGTLQHQHHDSVSSVNEEQESESCISVRRFPRAVGCSQYECEFCTKNFRKYYDYVRHHRVHTREKPYKCAFCQRYFSAKTKVLDHSKIHRLDEHVGIITKQYPCAVCCQTFSSLRLLDNHMSTHAESYIVKYKCMACEAIFNSSSKLMSHKHLRSDEEVLFLQQLIPPPVEVLVNPNANASDNSPKCTSIKAKPNSDKLKCCTCERLFSSSSVLRNHRRIYHGAYSRTSNNTGLAYSHYFRCAYCARLFKTSSHCRTHMLTHLKNLLNVGSTGQVKGDQIPPKVSIVNAIVIITDTTIKANIKIAQFNILAPKQTKAQKGELIRPLCAKALLRHKCHFCSSQFVKSCDLKRHLVTHTRERMHECSTCRKSFSLRSTLRQHRLVHEMERKKHICIVCGKTYSAKKSLNVHLRLHTGEQPFACEHCALKFRTSGQRITHLKVVHGLKKYVPAEKD
ncbi:zinc finger protein 91-like isoform X2 [Rhagoletis pomonella]|uniref:zinc finger protein 91-like isoform X2 n=1 Tax=Rhagoletis pomonella TaxID=28610 RepID=UPI0017829D30|nr:zinc finger protein 91-like isoform X2 [Rhagoletis pomonella]